MKDALIAINAWWNNLQELEDSHEIGTDISDFKNRLSELYPTEIFIYDFDKWTIQ